MQDNMIQMLVKGIPNGCEPNALKNDRTKKRRGDKNTVLKYCSTVHRVHYQTCFSLQVILQSPQRFPKDEYLRRLLGKCEHKSSLEEVYHKLEVAHIETVSTTTEGQ